MIYHKEVKNIKIKKTITRELRKINKKKNLKKLSDITLRDLILRSNKEDVIDFSLSLLKKSDFKTVYKEIVHSEIYKGSKYLRTMLSKEYELFVEIAKKEVLNKNHEEVYTSIFDCDGWDFDDLFTIVDIYTSYSIMDEAVEFPELSPKNTPPKITSQIIINAKLDKKTANSCEIEVVAKGFLQLLYIEIINGNK